MNTTPRMNYSTSHFTHISPFLRQLLWPKAHEQTDYKLVILVHKCIMGLVESTLLINYVIRLILRTSETSFGVISKFDLIGFKLDYQQMEIDHTYVGHSFPDIYFQSREFGNRFSHSREREFPTESGR